jgi:hypothetical protein
LLAESLDPTRTDTIQLEQFEQLEQLDPTRTDTIQQEQFEQLEQLDPTRTTRSNTNRHDPTGTTGTHEHFPAIAKLAC